MDKKMEFDSTLGGKYNLPNSLNLHNFTAARAKEIQSMKQALLSTKSVKLAFQTLPKHMRRRVMSHSAKRLPRRIREKHLSQLNKSGLPAKQKRPTRKFRRRPQNFLNEMKRRSKKCNWLQTHIWHAKRFHMVKKWGYKLPDRSYDKTFRACYRATAKHCLINDISYISCIEVVGHQDVIIQKIKSVCKSNEGLSVGAKAYLTGNREGSILIYDNLDKPIGDVTFIWKPVFTDNTRTLWIWAHAAYYNKIFSFLKALFNTTSELCEGKVYSNSELNIKISSLKEDLSRLRLTGPLSQSVLNKVFKTVDSSKVDSVWFKKFLENDEWRQVFAEQLQYWNSIRNFNSPALVSPHIALSLIVVDPRFTVPVKRTKAVPGQNVGLDINVIIPEKISFGPIWEGELRKEVMDSKISTGAINDLRSQLLVPGSDLQDCGKPVPILLIQRPGGSSSGYCSGWDLILQSSWTQPLWLALIMWGARPGGLREMKRMYFEMGKHFFSPDSESGSFEEEVSFRNKVERFFRLPPAKRTNFNKFAIVSPFKFSWKILIKDWTQEKNLMEDFSVLRDKSILKVLQESLNTKNLKSFPKELLNKNLLIPVIVLPESGIFKENSIICLPNECDITSKLEPVEPLKKDNNQQRRKLLRSNHKKSLTSLKKKSKTCSDLKSQRLEEVQEYQKKMRELWLPEVISNIRNSCSRQIIGFVTTGDFSFVHGRGVCLSYIVADALPALIPFKKKVLVRSTNSRQYRFSELNIIAQ